MRAYVIRRSVGALVVVLVLVGVILLMIRNVNPPPLRF
jgi:hypothetical protein